MYWGCWSDDVLALTPFSVHSCLVSYEPLHHKYRPQTFANLVGQEAIATTLTNAILTERIAPAYLFTGSRGTGKTSSARILAKSLNCQKQDTPTESPCGVCEVCISIASSYSLDVIEIDAASNTGVDNIRELIEKAQFAPVQCRYKVYIIDEVHMLSTAAFNALLKTLEEPPARVVFVLATTDPQRVLPTIISRCQKFDFRRIPLEAMVKHLLHIASQENIHITSEAITLVAQVAQGGLRDAESLLDQLSLLPAEVTVEAVWDLVGVVPERDLMALTKAIADDNSEAVLEQCRRLMDRGREPLVVLQNLAGFYRDLLIARTAPNRNDLVAVTRQTWEELREFAKSLDAADILQAQQQLKNSEAQVKNTTQPRLWLEVTLLGLLPSAQVARDEGASSKVSTSQRSSRDQPQSHRDQTPQVQQPASPVVSKTEASTNDIELPKKSSVEASEASLQSSGSPQPQTEKPIEPSISAASNSSVSTPTTEAEPSTVTNDINQIWQQVLAHLQPVPTRELLRQLGHLTSLDSHSAFVSIPPAWREKIQEKVPNIEAAFQDALNCKVKVILQGMTSKPANTTVNTPAIAVKSSGQATETTPTPASHPPTNQPVPENASSREPMRQVSSEMVDSVGRNKTSLEQTPTKKEPQAREELNRGNLQSTSSLSPQQIVRQHLYEVEQTTAYESSSSQFSTSDTPTDVYKEHLEHPKGMSLQTFQADVTFEDAAQVEKAIIDLKQFFEGQIIDLRDEFLSIEPVISPQLQLEKEIEEVAEELASTTDEDEPEVFITHQQQSNSIAMLYNRPDLSAFENLDEEDIPF